MKNFLMGTVIVLGGLIITAFLFLNILLFLPSSTQEKISALAQQVLGQNTEIVSSKTDANIGTKQLVAETEMKPAPVSQSNALSKNDANQVPQIDDSQTKPVENPIKSNDTKSHASIETTDQNPPSTPSVQTSQNDKNTMPITNSVDSYITMLDPFVTAQFPKDSATIAGQIPGGHLADALIIKKSMESYVNPILNTKAPQGYQVEAKWETLQNTLSVLMDLIEKEYKYALDNDIASVSDTLTPISDNTYKAQMQAFAAQSTLKANSGKK